MKKQIKFKAKAVVLAVALAIVPAVAVAANVDSVTGQQAYAYQNAAGQVYQQYDFDNGELIMSNNQYCGERACTPLYPSLTGGAIGLNAVTVKAGSTGSIYLGKSAPASSLLISGTGMPGTGDFEINTDRTSYNLYLTGDQGLGASNLTLDGSGTVNFGDAALSQGDTQSLATVTASAMTAYNADVTITGGITLTGYLTQAATSSSSTINFSKGDNSSFAGIKNTGANALNVNFDSGSLSGVGARYGGTFSATGNLNLNFDGTHLAMNLLKLDAANVIFSDGAGGDGGVMELLGGRMTVDAPYMEQYGLSFNQDGEGSQFRMTGGTLVLQNAADDYTGAGGMNYYDIYSQGGYTVTGGTVIFDAEKGGYKAGTAYTLLKSGSEDVSNTFAPGSFYYVYNSSKSTTIDGLDPELKVGTDKVQVVLSTPAKAPAKAKTPAKTPGKTPPVHKITPIKIRVVTPVQEASRTLVSTPSLTIQQARDASQVLVSSGIVGGGPRGLWFKGMGGAQQVDDEKGANYGLIAGYGWSVGPHGDDVAGVAFSAGQSGMGTGPQDFAKASDYALWTYGTAYFPLQNPLQMWKVAGTLGAGLSTNTVSSTALGLPQVADFGGHFVSGEVRASFWDTLPGLDNLIVSPRLSIGYTQSWTNGYKTHGGSFLNVRVHSASAGQLYIEQAVLIGKKFNYRTIAGNHTLFPQVRLGIVQNIGPTPSAMVSSGQVAAQIAGLGYPHTQGMAEVRLDVTSHTKYSHRLSGNISVRQLFGGGASSTEAMAAIKYRW